MLTLITQSPEPSITELLLTLCKIIGKSGEGGEAFELRRFGEKLLSQATKFSLCSSPLLV